MLKEQAKEMEKCFQKFEEMTNLYTHCISEINKFKTQYHIEFKPMPSIMLEGNKIFNKKAHEAFFKKVLSDKNTKAKMKEMIEEFQQLKELFENFEVKVKSYLEQKKMNEGNLIIQKIQMTIKILKYFE